ncbi:dihydrofolate reductase [Necator americanus]|uniref:dihydrofolate reductase n=1 Tax=Necator americanus TaxID=51031 RepID=W2SZD9_NECAM|nr:dihydrofolate reductase [Necator americanus]ETN75105.1 dihydrofolate reductase [Necator americanus]
MEFFRENTTTTVDLNKVNAVVMGRKCWESIPEKFKPLKKRLNVVISRTLPARREKDLIVSDNFDGIIKELMSGELSEKVEKVWNIGGAEIYKLALESGLVGELLITKIRRDFDADVFLQSLNWYHFKEEESSQSESVIENGIEFSFHRYLYVK